MAKKAAADATAMRAGVHDVSCAHGTARVHVPRNRTARDIARAFRPLTHGALQGVVAMPRKKECARLAKTKGANVIKTSPFYQQAAPARKREVV